MIFITLGTQDKSFYRLLDYIEQLIDKKVIQEKVIVQAGYTAYSSKYMEILDYVSMEQFEELMDDCRILITHGGVGSIMSGLAHGKKIIALPRLAKYQEHTNDHQVQIVEKLEEEGYILGAIDLKQLEEKLIKINDFVPKKYQSNTSSLIKLIEDYIDQEDNLSWKEKGKKLYQRYQEILLYLLFGGLTTLVNIISYYVFTRLFPLGEYVSNIIAWFISVIFAFITNKLFVFDSKSKKGKVLVKELFSFFSFRLLSLGIDMGAMYLMISIFHWHDLLAKILSNGIVIILNYIFSKWFIFKKEVK